MYYDFQFFVDKLNKNRKMPNYVIRTALKALFFNHPVKYDEHHKKNHFVFYTARHRI